MNIPYRPLALGLLVIGFSALVLGRAQAGGGHFYAPVSDAVVKEECGGCHLAFAPSMLPARSWARLMADLKNHFGDDASVDAATAKKITDYLTANAADQAGTRYGNKLLRDVSVAQAPLRITELPRWVKEHREVTASEWKQPAVRSKANCSACHTGAERGYYED
ncbi:MAG: diheme cytochrome c [Polaromonas sp.]|nr:diheme cytochrome c [Polaromonas sp.]